MPCHTRGGPNVRSPASLPNSPADVLLTVLIIAIVGGLAVRTDFYLGPKALGVPNQPSDCPRRGDPNRGRSFLLQTDPAFE
jgi:hypothetical protein